MDRRLLTVRMRDLITAVEQIRGLEGADGGGGTHGGSAFTPRLTLGAAIAVLANGRGDMPAYGGLMSADEIQDVAAYVLELANDR